MTRLDEIWDELFPAEQQRIVRVLIEKVIVSPQDIEVRLRANGIDELALELRPAEPGEVHECDTHQEDRRAPGHPSERRAFDHLRPHPNQAARRTEARDRPERPDGETPALGRRGDAPAGGSRPRAPVASDSSSLSDSH